MIYTITVAGKPEPAGSKRAFVPKGWTRAVVTDANAKAKPWKRMVAACAEEQAGRVVLEGPLKLTVVFELARPKGHLGKNGVRASAPAHPTVKPDATKLLRGVEDALTGILWRDDAQIVEQHVTKRYTELAPLTTITVETL